MENYTWTTGFLTLELLPDGTIHMENTSINGDTDEEELIFDKINKIIIHEDDDILALEADGCGYDFPQLGAKFLAETKGRFPISEPTPYPEIKMRLDQQSLLGWVLELEFNGSRRKLEAFFQFCISGFLQIQLFDFQFCFRRHPIFPVKPFHGSFPDFWSWQLRIVLNDPQNPGNVFLLPDHSQEHHRTPGFDPDAALIKTFSDQGQTPFWKGIEGLNRLQPFCC